MSTNIAVLNDELDFGFDLEEALSNLNFSREFVTYALEAHELLDHMCNEYMDEAELSSMISRYFNEGRSMGELMRTVDSMTSPAEDHWDD